MFSTEFAYTLEAAYREAANRKHAYFCIEHILFALLFDEAVCEVIENSGGDAETLKADLEEFFDTLVEKVKDDPGEKELSVEEITPIQTPAVQSVLQRAIIQMQVAGKDSVSGGEVLIQIFDEAESHGAYFLKKQGIEKVDIMNFVSQVSTKLPLIDNEDKQLVKSKSKNKNTKTKDSSLLEKFTENLTEQAKAEKLDPVIERDKEISRLIKILCRRQKNNPILIGEPGVGKTALASALAQKIISDEVPEILKNAEVYSLQVGSLIAGTKFRGEFENRLNGIVKELIRKENAILFIDEIHTIVGAGSTGSGSLDAANILKPALAEGKLRCVGSTTYEEYKKSIGKDRALTRRFSKLEIDEPTIEQTFNILKKLKSYYEDHHNVAYTDSALNAAAKLSSKYINDRFLPDKAIDVIDEAGAANSLLAKSKRKTKITEKEIREVVESISKVPVKDVNKDELVGLKNLEITLKSRVFSQDEALEAITKAIKRSRANLKEDTKPVGSFLFAGPTGVGKTELAKVLAETLAVPFHRFDMSEYMEKHTVSRLVGSPPGYVGYEEGGILTDLVRKKPYAVLLLDEIEKAHPDIFNILLQVMDTATLTDSHGKKADFRNVILIMTSNAGSEGSNSMGFGNAKSHSKRDDAIKKLFRPEFRNRLDEIIYFNPLGQDTIKQIVDKFILELDLQLLPKKVKLKLTEEARVYLAENGFNEELGARPMSRLIQKEIKDRLADEILFGKLKKGGNVLIDCKDSQIKFLFD